MAYPKRRLVAKNNFNQNNNVESSEMPVKWFSNDMIKPLGATVLFGVSSVLIMAVNKTILTTYNFPSFNVLGLGQILTTIILLGLARWFEYVNFPSPSRKQIEKIFPLPIFYVLTLVFGLGSTQKLNLPMFTVLRRFTLLFISIGQIYILDQYESLPVNITLVLMIMGAIFAALNDFAFDAMGYVFVFLNDFTTAASSLYNKKKLNSQMSKYEIMFYNALVVVGPTFCWAAYFGDFGKAYHYEGWYNPWFLINFGLSCGLGFVLIYSQILVTQLTSPLTLTVTGCIKNVVVTYGGMFIWRDYVYDHYNFIGITISVVASLMYSYFKYNERSTNVVEPMKPTDIEMANPNPTNSNTQESGPVEQKLTT